MKKTNKAIDEAIMDYSLDGITLARKIGAENNIKQAMFSITLCDVDGFARISPIACGNMCALATALCQAALNDENVKQLILCTMEKINDGFKMPTAKEEELLNK